MDFKINLKEFKINYQTKRKVLILLLGLFLIGTSLEIGYYIGKERVICEVCPPQDLDFSLFWETYNKLKTDFYKPEKIDDKKLLYGAISGMVGSLGDPYTVFLSPDETKKFMEDITGRFEGVGMEIGIRNKILQVVAPLEGTPADKAGLRAGDQILKINGKDTSDLTVEEAASLIRGPRGTKVTLTILRKGWESPKDIEIERALVEVPSLTWKLIGDSVAYVKIYQFSEKASLDFTKISVQILASGADRIIIDLRNNPGGYLEVAKDIAGFFLERGDVVVIEDFGKEETRQEYKAGGSAIFLDYPVVILINEGSASGSEILAGALRDDRGIKLIGQDSFGKGSVQQLETLREGAALKVTTAEWLTPKGQTISEVGLKPDIKVEMTEKDYEEDKDPQLDKALEIIKGL